MHKKITFIEIDPSKGNIFPGSLSILEVDSIVDYQEGFKLNNPYLLYYGNTEIDNPELYDLQIDALIRSLNDRKLNNFNKILAPEMSTENLNNLIKKFKVTETVFVGDERMYNRINLISKKVYIENSIYISENTVPKSIHRYLNGINNDYTPCSFVVKGGYEVVRIGEEHVAPESALPLGGNRKVGKTAVNKVELNENCVLAISEAKEESEVTTSPVVGFVICVDEKKFRVLSPQPKLPKNNFLIQGKIKYIDF